MKKILKIFEEEEEKELTDYEKILALNKRKIDPYDTHFDGCDGEVSFYTTHAIHDWN